MRILNITKMFKIVLLMIAFTATAFGNLNVQRCVQTGALPRSVTISGCTSPPCIVTAGSTIDVRVTFVAPGTIRNMWAQLTGYRNNRPTSHDMGDAGMPCRHLVGNQCPINGGQTVVYTPRIFVNNNIIQGVTIPVELRVRDHNTSPVMCFRIDVRVAARALTPGFAPKQASDDETKHDN